MTVMLTISLTVLRPVFPSRQEPPALLLSRRALAAFVLVAGMIAVRTLSVASRAANEVTTPSGLRYVDVKTGSGATARAGQTAVVHYTGWLNEGRSEEHTSELQSLMRISYAVFCLKQTTCITSS